MKKEFYSNGKLLITGEYVVLDGATALAFPTKFGQTLTVTEIDEPAIQWKSFDSDNHIWFQYNFSISEIDLPLTIIDNEEKRLISILKEARKLNPSFLNGDKGFMVTTKLDFPKNWGLGSSSTLINNISQWANVDPFKLLNKTFGGSGYDIAAAQYNTPILYSKLESNLQITERNINWKFTDQLFFVHLNKKQNSRDGIVNYQKTKSEDNLPTNNINKLTFKFCQCESISEFSLLIDEHEQLISKTIQQKTVKDRLFTDYIGSIKSLGAWGGDFILVTGSEKDKDYFKEKGYKTILNFKEMIL